MMHIVKEGGEEISRVDSESRAKFSVRLFFSVVYYLIDYRARIYGQRIQGYQNS